jgi:hypothetical protein
MNYKTGFARRNTNAAVYTVYTTVNDADFLLYICIYFAFSEIYIELNLLSACIRIIFKLNGFEV